ncbi:hypothetical protein JOQ06_007525 [Pogonophryne albipinna]|uniref:Uncharacterized protein n=1 Tax=Pogonophryne albipinna TaxID=1090488 RepID=A0AAD6B0W4_9TELE|nr:hypothetical protein JOQ06_007525 [Pogonophryne albipinna]
MRGVISGVPMEISIEELKKEIKGGKVSVVKRLPTRYQDFCLRCWLPLPAALTQPSKCRVAIAICYIAYLSVSVPRNNRGLSLSPAFISGVHLSRPTVHILLPCRGSSSSLQQSSTPVHLAR